MVTSPGSWTLHSEAKRSKRKDSASKPKIKDFLSYMVSLMLSCLPCVFYTYFILVKIVKLPRRDGLFLCAKTLWLINLSVCSFSRSLPPSLFLHCDNSPDRAF